MPFDRDLYEAPSYLDTLANKDGIQELTLGRMKELRDMGRAFIESQPAWAELPRAYEILSGDNMPQKLTGYSTVHVNRIKRNFRDLVATVSNLKPAGQAVTKKKEAAVSVDRLNKMKNLWWIVTKQDRKYRQGCQYACGLGTAYLELWWDNNFYGFGDGEIACKVHGPSDVLPVMLTEDFDLQKAYAVTVCEEVPLHLVLAAYPALQHKIEPSRSVPGWIGRAWDRMKRAVGNPNGVLGNLDTPQRSFGRQMPVVDVYTTYIMDTSVNNTGRRIPMGDPGTSWQYEVPFVGQMIPAGVRDLQGKMIMKPADEDDARLFPLRRRVIWTDTCILKDGTSPFLHGRVPLVPMRFDDYAWEYLGHSIVQDTWRIQKAINQILRAVVDSVLVRLQPPLKHDPNLIDKTAMARINTRKPGQTVEVSSGMGNPIEPLLPVQHWDVPQWILQVVSLLFENLDNLSVVKDLMAVAKAKQVPSADSIEKILEQAGPVVQDIARGGEVATQELDALFYPLALQFWDSQKVFHLLGEDGAVQEMIDFRPGELIPSHLPGEDPRAGSSIYTQWERVRWTIKQLSYVIEPYSQAQVSRIGRNLILMQAKKAGVTVSAHTIGKGLGLNMGELPAMRNGKPPVTEPEKWEVEQEWMHALQEDLSVGQQGDGGGPGRPNVNRKPPSIAQKDQGTRSTVKTS
jgi:hypothetical protein